MFAEVSTDPKRRFWVGCAALEQTPREALHE